MEYRVSVCLTRFFNDERSYCYIHLDTSYDTVGAFEQFLRRQFRLPNPFCLMTDNHLLPSEQTIKIIRPSDTITVVPLSKDWRVVEEAVEPERNAEVENDLAEVAEVIDVAGSEKISKKKKKKKSKPEAAESSVSTEEYISAPKKEKQETPELDTENESDKKKDSDMDVSMGSDVDRDNAQPLEDVHDVDEHEPISKENNSESGMEPHKMAEMQSAIQQLKLKALSMLTEVASQKPVAGVSGGRINKRKRIRKRNKNTSLSVSTPDLSDSTASPPLTFKPVKKSSSHIRFDNDQPAIVHNCPRNSDLTTKPRIIHAIENDSINNSRRTSLCGSPPSDNGSVCGSSIYPSAIQNLIGNGKTSIQPNKEPGLSVESVKKRLSEFPVMDDVYPVPKDLILFKMLKIGNDYTPSLSDSILANVLEVDKANGVVKLSILDGHKECLPTSGKFDLEPQKKELSSTKECIIDVSWGQVSEARLIFP